jgi:hypothetical protein
LEKFFLLTNNIHQLIKGGSMRYKYFSLFLSLMFIFTISLCYGQSAPIDEKAPYVVNPNPHILDPISDVPVEEIIATNQNMFGAGPRTRGNMFACTSDNYLVEHRMWLNPSAQTQMMFVVYEGMAPTGVFNAISMVDVSPQGPGVGWYSSGAIEVPLIAGRHYMIVVGFEQITNYWTQNPVSPYPYPVAFGQVTAGAGWHWAPGGLIYPPAAVENVDPLIYGDPVAYYQTIVTDTEVPVELMSFTYDVSGNNTILNWVTASEKNNHGFEVQRKVADEFIPIAFIEGHGTTTETHRYSYTDRNLEPGIYTYRLKQVDLNGAHYYYDELFVEITPPAAFDLSQNYPNPFNPSTKISYNLAVDSRVTLTVYNLLGETVTTLVNTNVPAGEQEIVFDASDLNSGVYFYRIDAVGVNGTEFSSVKKMMLAK